MAIDLGTGFSTDTGTALFGLIGPAITGMGALAVASAIAAIGVAIIRHMQHPNDESAVATLHRVRRVLMVISFLSVSGAVFAWIITGTSPDEIPGVHYIRSWF